ncbi:DUF3000 domain-containing protein [Nakamurella antarctica]|uniref:DUF3000 domain-containing protein n=1 Tax=Nakamurella antarctica TaxID=1902245 RepID=A0A3G8ZK43_9ACTN|nr:DUF3000 domain-containing protein [Nakamurella antarctica]AZI57702.1 DUF3000 domain-containing protein [Nakamurella antarctica]
MASPTSPLVGAPDEFLAAVAGLDVAHVRREIELSTLPAPARLAPWTHAVSALIHDTDTDEEIGSGRLVLLHNPEGVAAWEGTFRYVAFLSCEVEGGIARDPLLPDVAWSWLAEVLDQHDVNFTALGGTVTATSSVRFGDIAGSDRTDDVEIRASWTAVGNDSASHMRAFIGLLAIAAGLPPEGVVTLSAAKQSGDQ